MKRQNSSIALATAVVGLVVAFVAFGDGQTSASKKDDTGGRGATQKWVNMRIAQSESNTLARVDEKMATLSEQVMSTIAANADILADTSNTNAVKEATQNCLMSASSLANYLMDDTF